MPPQVSIVIPCFNAAETLRETVNSALAQSYQEVEVVVVDDGSTDGSGDIIRSFGASVRSVFQPNHGASAARNQGTKLARGEYLQYLDADDVLVADAVEQRVAALEESGADVAYTDWQRLEKDAAGEFYLGEKVVRSMESVDPDPEIACATEFWAPPAALLYRRRIVDAIGGWNESLPVIQDARFLFDAARVGARFVHVAGIGAYYRTSSRQSLSRQDERAFVQDVYRNACQIQELWQARALTERHRKALGTTYDYVSRNFFQWGMDDEFTEAVGRLRSVWPRRPFHYPEIASCLSRTLGNRLARRILDALVTTRITIHRTRTGVLPSA